MNSRNKLSKKVLCDSKLKKTFKERTRFHPSHIDP